MQAIKNKLKSQAGASVIFALLLFLVCAVVGSAVLTAGTAASGRMSGLAEMDQRYYSVNSAARLLIDLITAEEIQVEKTTDNQGEQPVETFKYYKLAENEREEIVVAASYPSLTVEAAYQIAQGFTEKPVRTITINPDNSGALLVTARETIYPDGYLEMKLWNGDSDAEDKGYSIYLGFAAETFRQTRDTDLANNREIETTTLKWKLSEVWQDNV